MIEVAHSMSRVRKSGRNRGRKRAARRRWAMPFLRAPVWDAGEYPADCRESGALSCRLYRIFCCVMMLS